MAGSLFRHPFALSESGPHGVRIAATNPEAEEKAVRVGMALGDARALCPGLKLRPLVPSEAAGGLIKLVRWATRYSPWVNSWSNIWPGPGAGPGQGTSQESNKGAVEYGLMLDISGCAHLFGGEEAMVGDISRRLNQAGIAHVIGVSDVLGAAFALSRFGTDHHHIAPPGEGPKAIAELPVQALRLDNETALTLGRLGLKTIGSLYELPRVGIERRFHSLASAATKTMPKTGPKARPKATIAQRTMGQAVLKRLDQATGKVAEPLSPLLPAPAFRARMRFAEPVLSDDGILAALDGLMDDLCVVLNRAGQGARRISLWAYRVDGDVKRIELGFSRPTRDPAHMTRLTQEKLKGLDPGFGIDLLILAADQTDGFNDDPGHGQQALLIEQPVPGKRATRRQKAPDSVTLDPAAPDPAAPDPAALGRLVDRLSNRLGKTRIGQLSPRESHIPERAQKTRMAAHGGLEGRALALDEGSISDAPMRPFRLLGRPEPIDVVASVPEGPPLRFKWRRQVIRVRAAEGPERISPEWWLEAREKRGSVRDYYRVEDETGHRYWLYRDGFYGDHPDEGGGPSCAPHWYLHGLFA
jgi:protein ImuB